MPDEPGTDHPIRTASWISSCARNPTSGARSRRADDAKQMERHGLVLDTYARIGEPQPRSKDAISGEGVLLPRCANAACGKPEVAVSRSLCAAYGLGGAGESRSAGDAEQSSTAQPRVRKRTGRAVTSQHAQCLQVQTTAAAPATKRSPRAASVADRTRDDEERRCPPALFR